MKKTFSILCLFFYFSAFGQLKPDIFPEDINTEESHVRCFCKPGVRNKSRSKGVQLSYANVADGRFKNEEGSLSGTPSEFDRWSKFEFDLKAPVINADGFKFLVGYKYTSEYFNVSRFGPDYREAFQALDENTLKSGNLSAIFTKPLNEKNYIGLRLRYSANGNYDGILNLNEKYAVYKALAIFGVKKSDDFEWGIGLNFSKSFRRTNFLPFIVYNRNFNARWGIESAFPGYLYGRYNINQKTIFLFGLEYGSDSYRLTYENENLGSQDYALNQSELLSLLRIQKQFAPWIWGNIRTGYQMNFSTDFESKSVNSPEFMVDPSSGLYFEVGVFISPPDDILHK